MRVTNLVARVPGVRGAAATLQTLRFRWRHRGDRPIVVVHQMARVGSITVLRAIRRSAPATNLFHTHYLNPATIRRFALQSDHVFETTHQLGLHRELLAARWLSARLQGGARQRWRIVSLVRDPVARTISAFFRHFPYTFPALGAAFRDDPANVPRLLGLFRNDSEAEHDFALSWFDREVRDVFGIDVYDTAFPSGIGFATYAGQSCDLLVLRLEDLERVGRDALQDFLGLRDVRLAMENSAQRESYAESYRLFLRELRPTREYLNRMYDSRFARHFYTPEEIARLRDRWSALTSDL